MTEIPKQVPKRSLGAEVDAIDREAERNPLIGAKITDLMAGPTTNRGIERAQRNASRARLTQIDYSGSLGGGTPKNKLEVNTHEQSKDETKS